MLLFLVTDCPMFHGCYLTAAAVKAARIDGLLPDDSYSLTDGDVPAKSTTIDYNWADDTYYDIKTLKIVCRSLIAKWT